VFSVGVLLHELIANRPLFGTISLPRPGAVRTQAPTTGQSAAIRRRLASAPISRLDALPLLKKTVSKELAELVARALERDATRRFPNVDAMLEAVRKLGPKAVGSHEDVAAHVAKVCGQSDPEQLGAVAINSESDAPVSNRPTVPPQSARSTAPPAGVDPEATQPGSMRPTALTLPNFVLPTDATMPSEPPESIEPELISGGEESVPSVDPVSVHPVDAKPEPRAKGPPPAPSALRSPEVAPSFPLPIAVSSLPNDSSDGNTDLTAADQALAGLPGKRAGLSRPVLIGGAALLGLIAIVAVVRAFGGSSETPREKTSSISSVTPASGGNAPRAPSAEPTLEVDEPVQAPTETAAKSPAPSAASEQPLTVETAIQAPPEASVPVQQPAAMPRRPSAPAAPRTQPTPTPAPKPPSTSKQPFRPSGI
jgi:hypothetical protein